MIDKLCYRLCRARLRVSAGRRHHFGRRDPEQGAEKAGDRPRGPSIVPIKHEKPAEKKNI